MDVARFQTLHQRFTGGGTAPAERDSEDFEAYVEAREHDPACAAIVQAEILRKRGIDPGRHCCIAMSYHLSSAVDPAYRNGEDDAVVRYVAKFDEYALAPRDPESAAIAIRHCPWCGTALPQSRRAAWFEAVEALDLDAWDGDVPEKLQTDAWWRDG